MDNILFYEQLLVLGAMLNMNKSPSGFSTEGRWHTMKAQTAHYGASVSSRRWDHFLFAAWPQFSLHIKSERLGED